MGNRGPDRVAAVRRMVAAHLPGRRVDSVVPVGEGTDHLAYEVNGELIVRWSREPNPAARAAGVDREARLLAALHAAPTEGLAALVDVDDQPPAEWRREAARTYATVAGAVPAAPRRPVEAFLAAPPPAESRCGVFEDLAYGIRTGRDAYVDKSLAAMAWLFPA
jgi:aminoglycoside phosphotransferase (APT) family kinase protein